MSREKPIQTEIMLEATRQGARLLRNNNGAYRDSMKQWVKYGVGAPGGSDLLGWVPLKIEAHHVGKTVAVFFACECKANGSESPSEDQKNFLNAVTNAGGLACVCWDPKVLPKVLLDFITELKSQKY